MIEAAYAKEFREPQHHAREKGLKKVRLWQIVELRMGSFLTLWGPETLISFPLETTSICQNPQELTVIKIVAKDWSTLML